MRKRVAILGYSYRLPASASGRFWDDLLSGRNLVTAVAADRWAQDGYWHPRKSHAGTSYTFAAGSVGDVSAFDAGFFGISPREAAQMDPQQRLLLEVSWEALENSGVRPSDIRGTRCGVYVGVSTIDYSFRFADDPASIDSAVATGTASSITANRLSYFLDLHGPSLAVDTACSSSLVAFHLACQSILAGESVQALAGGVSLHTHPYGFITFSKASMLSRRGACNVFDEAGDGYVRSEGCGVFLLKNYEQAVADGNRILAVVAGSAVNSDGRKAGLTVPSAQAQAELLRQAYSDAGIDPENIDYIEAHGTGTAVGDPVETRALGEALGQRRSQGAPLLIGSVKSNLGHPEAAAGIAGLVKALHCIEHRTVPATIGVNQPNSKIRFDEWNLKVVTENTPLKRAGDVIIGINSFGFGGANAHVIVRGEAASRQRERSTIAPAVLLPIAISGKTQAALKAAALDLAWYVREKETPSLYDIAYTTVFHRDWHDHRAVVMARDHESLAAVLERFAGDDPVPALPAVESGAALAETGGLAFVYSGNGSQWQGMGSRLMAEEPAFRAAVQAVDALFSVLAGYSLEKLVAGDSGPAHYELTEIAQPALFAVQVGITQVLRQRGMVPAAVAGHSVGEVAAAWACGALSLEQAVHVIYHRSRLQARTRDAGRMTAVGLGERAVRDLLRQLGLSNSLSVAGVNSSNSSTVAGLEAALQKLERHLDEGKVFHRRLELDYAFHSPAMDPVRDELLSVLGKLRPADGSIAFYSTVTGGLLSGRSLGADYWWRNIREPVLFDQAIKTMLAAGARVFTEVGPHALLRGYVSTCLKDEELQGRVIPTLLRNDDAPARLWATVSQVAIAGGKIGWEALFPRPGQFTRLPNYPWQRERHWHDVSSESYQKLNRRREHPLLGYRLHENEWAWENHIDTHLCPSLVDHVIGEANVMPGSAFAEMALAAARLWSGGDGQVEIEQLEIRAPLVLSEAKSKVVRFSIDVTDGRFGIASHDHLEKDEWTLHATGRILREAHDVLLQQAPVTTPVRPPDSSGADHETLTRAVGLQYGPAFRAIESIWVENGAAYATFNFPQAVAAELDRVCLHPALLDCTFQLIIQLLKHDYLAHSGSVYVPAKITSLNLRCGNAVPKMARATLLRSSPHSVTASFTLHDTDGETIAWIPEARFNSVRLRKNPADRLRYLDYHAVPRPHPLSPLAAPRGLFECMRNKFADLARTPTSAPPLKRYTTEVEPLLDSLCGRFALRALKSLAGTSPVLTQADIQACTIANPDVAPLIDRLIGILREDGTAVPAGKDWHFLPDEDLPPAEVIWNSLMADHPDFLPVFHAVGRVGMHLEGLLRGRRTVEEVLPRESDLTRLACQVLGDSGQAVIERTLRDVIAETLERYPTGKRLRIAEVVASRPWFGGNVCRAVDFDRCDYVVATAAASMPEEIHRLQESFPNVEVRQIGNQASPAAASSPSQQFHLAIVTSDSATEQEALLAMTWVRRHLAAGGVVLVIEHYPSRWMDFVFGARRAWWTEVAGGTWISRHRQPASWRQAMQKMGFLGSTVLELSSEPGSGPYLLLSEQGEQTQADSPPPNALKTWVLLDEKDGYPEQIAGQLRRTLEARGDRVVRLSHGSRLAAVDSNHYQINPWDAGQLETLLRQVGVEAGGVSGILHLQGLESASTAPPLLLLEKQVDRCATAAALLRACEATGISTQLWLIAGRGASGLLRKRDRRGHDRPFENGVDAAVWGFGRTLMNEAPHLGVRLVEIDTSGSLETAAYALARELANPDAEQEIILTASGDRYVPRLRLEPAPMRLRSSALDQEPPVLRLALQAAGQLRNLRWESHPRVAPGRGELEILVHATGLNFRDVMYALGLLSEEAVEGGFAGATLGLEFAGEVASVGPDVRGYAPGDRVIGFGAMSFANRVIARAGCIAPIPSKLAFGAAATIPSAFFTAHYSLNHLARLEEGEKILIHGAAGGVGLAAVQLARQCGAEVFATAGSEEKRDLLRLMGADHVFDSRSLAFADEILALTGGEGIDVVLNSLAGEAINRNLRVLRPFGRFLELGKRDFQENTRIGLRPFRNNISYFGVDADQLMKERPQLTEKVFREVMALFRDGALHPLPYRCFEAGEVVDAFRYMQQSRHIGKVVVAYRNGITPSHIAGRPARRLHLPADATYLVTGGIGGFGRKTAEWLADKGARHLILVSRRGAVASDELQAIAALEARGVRVHAAACDITDRKSLSAVLSEASVTMPPLRGIVHAAAVIEDGVARNVTRNAMRRVIAPKLLGAHNLHELTAGKTLDFFIVYSSATTLFGNPGQGSYIAANAALEAFVASRRAAGLPALCVRWGAIEDAGYLARNTEIREALQARMGGSALQSAVALGALEDALLADRSGVAVLEFDWKALSRFLPAAGSPKFSEVAIKTEEATADEDTGEDARRLLGRLPAAEVTSIFMDMLKREVGEILRLSPDKIDENRSIYDMGFDSLMGVELATAIEARFSVRLPVMALSESPTIAGLCSRILVQLTASEKENSAETEAVSQARHIATQHADEQHVETIARTAEELQSSAAATARMIN